MRSLTVWLNGERRGVMVPSGLVGPLRWAVDLYHSSVRIDGPKPPPAAGGCRRRSVAAGGCLGRSGAAWGGLGPSVAACGGRWAALKRIEIFENPRPES